MRIALFYLGVFAVACAGMWTGHFLWEKAGVSMAQAEDHGKPGSDTIQATRLEILDSQGRRQILLSSTDSGAPGIWFFDKEGKVRLNLGLYPEGNSYVVLNDSNEQAVQIFRTVGGDNKPYLIFKAEGSDRMIAGLNSEPFLVYYDSKGSKKTLFGNY